MRYEDRVLISNALVTCVDVVEDQCGSDKREISLPRSSAEQGLKKIVLNKRLEDNKNRLLQSLENGSRRLFFKMFPTNLERELERHPFC